MLIQLSDRDLVTDNYGRNRLQLSFCTLICPALDLSSPNARFEISSVQTGKVSRSENRWPYAEKYFGVILPMGLERPSIKSEPQADRQYKRSSILAKSFLMAAAFAGVIMAGTFYTSGSTLFAAYSGDSVSESDRRARIEAFNSLQYLRVSRVDANDIPTAIDAMHLAPADRAKIATEIDQASGASSPTDSHAGSSSLLKGSGKPDTSALPGVADYVPHAGSAARPSPLATKATNNGSQLALAWVRLWDTDVEDGDVVRIESAGYSRTVTLTNRGITFAVPVPTSGQIRITGVRDGDGGGITVGLASGSAQAVLPIMSVGQVLILNVRTN